MRRTLFHILAAISFTLCVATAIVWIRHRTDEGDNGGRVAMLADESLFVSESKMTLLSLHLTGVHEWEPDQPTADPKEAAEAADWANRERDLEIKLDREELLDGGLLPGGRFAPDDTAWPPFHRDAWPLHGNGRFTCHWSYWRFTLPCWLIVAGAAVLPLLAVFKRVRSIRQRALGRCGVCGYDLRATPDRCPECGTIPPDRKPAAG